MKVNEIIGYFVSDYEGYYAYYHTKIEGKNVIIERRLIYDIHSRKFTYTGRLHDYIKTYDVRL